MDDQRHSKKKTVLLLGASSDQLFIIRTAKSMGLNVVTVDINPKSPGFDLADYYGVVSTRDIIALKAFIDDFQKNHFPISGVSVMGSDIPQIVVEIAQHLGTPSIPMEAALLATQKYNMKHRFKEAGIPIPWFQAVDSATELRKIITERGYPIIIKPVDRSGARGVFFLTPEGDLDALFETSRALAFSGQVMVEEYIEGLQLSTETIMYEGKAYTPGFADRNYEFLDKYKPNIIENGGFVPSIVTLSQRQAVEEVIQKAALALGITNGVVKGDIVLSGSGPIVIEIAARLSGGDFSESLIPLGCGVNIVEAVINLAVGNKVDVEKLKPKWQRGVINRYFFPQPGKLVSISGIERLENPSWLKKLEFWYQPGDIVPQVRCHGDRFGVFIVEGDTREEALKRAELVHSSIKIETVPI